MDLVEDFGGGWGDGGRGGGGGVSDIFRFFGGKAEGEVCNSGDRSRLVLGITVVATAAAFAISS